MKRVKFSTWAGALAAMTLLVSMTGCCEKEKKRINSLQSELQQAEQANMTLQNELAADEQRISQLENDVAVKEMTITSLRNKQQEQPPVRRGPVREGEWEKGLKADRLTIESDILFPSGKASLTSSGKAKLDQAVRDLKQRYAGQKVRIYGFTDTDPIVKTKNLWNDNLDLSANRAMSVTRYLRERGIDPKQVETIAMGEFYPLSTKRQSRRVEIVVIKD
jgi:chemotaxis protein MotB